MSQQSAKELVGKEIAQFAKSGQTIGVGTGSTVDAAISALGERVKAESLDITFVPSSYQTAWQCEQLGFRVANIGFAGSLDWGFDGADAVDAKGNAIKGKGGALLEEKILAKKCAQYYLIVDETKVCADICAHCAVPVEVIPSALDYVTGALQSIGGAVKLRDGKPGKHGPIITEHGNLILDVTFTAFVEGLEQQIKTIVGVVDSGLFEGYADKVIVARASGIQSLVG